ncbi:MAG: AAA family ATPase [Anaerolineae bacterium]|nr:AAA family ATPase [Anaerolineae bacterium]
MFVGVGASVTGDTPILVRTRQGTSLLPIAEFVDPYYEDREEGYPIPVSGVETLGFEELDSKFKGSPKKFFGHSVWKEATAVFRHRAHEIYEIHYLGGVIRTTGDHSIFVRTRDGLKVKAARELQPEDVLVNLPFKVRGQYSPVHGTPHTIGAHQFSPLQESIMLNVWDDDPEAREKLAFALEQRGLKSQREIAEVIGVSQATVGHWQAGINVPRSLSRSYVKQELTERVPLSPELMRLFGYYTAEGRYGGGLEFVFGAHETNLHKDCIELMHRVFSVEPSLHSTTTNSLRIDYPASLGRFFARYCGNGSHNKHVPEMLWDLPRDYFLAYLEGYSLGDGYITQEGKLSMTSVSHRLITELTWLCAMHGIKVGVRKMELEGGRVISNKPLPDGEAWNLIIGKTSNPFTETDNLGQGKKPYVREVVVKPYEGYVYDLCGCENEAFFGGEKPILFHNSRVRDLFDQAKRHSPCIIFLDEIDAVGRHRGAGLGGSHDEREQTLNQILVEMDGFDTDTNVIIVAATNRPDILDPALLRPGRFDRRVVLDRPDIKGREEILKVHVRGKPLGDNVALRELAKITPGFVGADIENMVNEAAILAARNDKKVIEMPEFEEAIERVIAGPERKSRLISGEEKQITAYHEAGHAVVAQVLPKCDPVHKVSIVARGMASGYTIALPEEDRRIVSKTKFKADLAFALGGRAAEELVFGDVTTGAANDLERVTELARAMVTRYGMSDKLGPMTFGQKEELVFLGKEIGEQRDYSEAVAQEIDGEVRKIVHEAHERASDILARHREQLERIAQHLIEVETLDADEFVALFKGAPEKEPEAPESPPPVPVPVVRRPVARPAPERRKPTLGMSPAPAPA